ncbi:MAG: hypothetical protein GY777_01145 [Candidatus Brocadiaceae bacterium]|nr:hypothetical protein [Candidatus Brocadiaceae bacterium]
MNIINKLPCIISITILVFIAHLRAVLPAELSRDIMVIARHGSLENTPENTFAAFERTSNIGVRGLEVDVRRTKDNQLVLMTDDTISRTTNGKGYVNQLLYDEIKLYDAGSWKSEEFAGEKVPLLSEVLQFAKDRKLKLILNIKEYGIEQLTLSIIEQFDMFDHVYFSGRLETIRDKDMDIKGAQLVFLPPNGATNEETDMIHEKNKHVGTSLFGTDNRDKMREKMFNGVDIILTNYPSVAIDLLHFRTIDEPEEKEQRKKLETKIVGNKEQVKALIETITQGSPEESRRAALVFSTVPAEASVSPLIKRLTYKKPLKRFIPNINLSIPFFNKERTENKHYLPSKMVQRNITWALGLMENKEAVAPLVTQLKNADIDMKREIIQALKMIGDEQAVPALNETLLNDKNKFVRYDAARALGCINSPDSVFALTKALKNDKSWLVKGACAEALGKTGNNRGINRLKAILNVDVGDESSWARDKAAWALARKGTMGIEALVFSLSSNGVNTRKRSSWALIEIGDPAVPYLISALRDISKFSRERSAMILGWIGNKKAVIPLLRALGDREPEVRKMAAWALGKIGEDKAITALEQTLDDQNEGVAEYAKEAIIRLNYN